MSERICEQCGGPLKNAKQTRYCGRSCAGRALCKPCGGISIAKNGRAKVVLRSGNGQLYSRCLMEGHLGRVLTYDEVVHHVNGDHTDDRIENLTVLTRQEHIKLHRHEIPTHGKLTPEQIEEIRTSSESDVALGRKFGVHDSAIWYHRKKFRQLGALRDEMRADSFGSRQ